jgi:hypothetical protein
MMPFLLARFCAAIAGAAFIIEALFGVMWLISLAQHA